MGRVDLFRDLRQFEPVSGDSPRGRQGAGHSQTLQRAGAGIGSGGGHRTVGGAGVLGQRPDSDGSDGRGHGDNIYSDHPGIRPTNL